MKSSSYSIKASIALPILLWLTSLGQEVVAGETNLTAAIAYHYRQSFAPAFIAESKCATKPASLQPSPENRKGKKNTFLEVSQVKLAETTQRKVILRTILSDIKLPYKTTDIDCLNSHAWVDLTLFVGPPGHPKHHLLSRINRTKTLLGECVLATLLATPTSDIALLSNRQRTIQLLAEQPTYLTDLKKILEDYRKVEPRLLSLWTPTDPLYTEEYRAYMRRYFLAANPRINKLAYKLNRRIFIRNCRDIYGEFLFFPLLGLAWCEGHYWMTSMAKGSFVKASRKESYLPFPLFIPGWSIGRVAYNFAHIDGKPSYWPFLGVTLINGLAVWRGYCGVKRYKEYSSVFQNLARRMYDVQFFIKTIQQISHIIAQNQPLEANYGSSLQAIRALLASNRKSEIGIMVANLLEMQLDHWSYFRGNGGKLLATYHLFEEHKDALHPAMYELGQLDALMGIATLMETAKAASPLHCYTFTKFLCRNQQKTPYVHINAMWNPLLDPETVVDNEVALDSHQTRNMILCGPNAGGKSSFLSGVAIGLLLSQVFGITPARQAVITPFNRIRTYIKVGDDVASGTSLFMVESDRMKQYMALLAHAHPEEFIFTIADEPFSGTDPDQAAAIAYSTLAHIAKYPNALHIVASHYPIVMDLANKIKGRGIQNYKVFVNITANQGLHYTYKIVPGSATQQIALKLLEQEGYDQEILNQAKDIIACPEKWTSPDARSLKKKDREEKKQKNRSK